MAPFVEGQLRYSSDTTIQVAGTPEAVEGFVGQSTRGSLALPITISVDSNDGWQPESPGEEFWSDLQELQDSLATSRGIGVPDFSEGEGYLLHPGLTPYLDELPEWLEQNLIRPVPGLLESGALLPIDDAERWRLAAGNLDVLQEIKGRFFATGGEAPSERGIAASTRGARAAEKRVDGFLVVGIHHVGMGCRRYQLENHGLAVNFLHYYTFAKASAAMKVGVTINAGIGRLAVDNAGIGTIRGPVVTQAISHWNATISPSEITQDVGVYIRNGSAIAACTYDLFSECQATGAEVEPGD